MQKVTREIPNSLTQLSSLTKIVRHSAFSIAQPTSLRFFPPGHTANPSPYQRSASNGSNAGN